MRPPSVVLFAALAVLGAGVHDAALANPESVALRRLAFTEAYRLNHEAAVAAARKAIAADPNDSGAHRALAAILWLNFMFTRGSVTADDYMGSMSQPNVDVKAPPRDFVDAFNESAGKALSLAERRLQAAPNDVAAHYEVGAAVGRRSAYVASVEGKAFSAFTMARRAFSEHEYVLEHDPSRKDAGLVLGTYRYIVATQSMMKRWMAYLIGFGGDRDRAASLLESCANYPSDVQTEARFVLVIVYNRERRYDDALRVLATLRQAFPENRLLWLESGATALRAGRAADAQAFLDPGVAMFERDVRPKSFGEGAVWHWKRGASLVRLGERDRAAADLKAALVFECRDWIRGRVQIEAGKLADLAGDRSAALQAYAKAMRLSQADNDPAGADEARALLKTPYRAK